MTRQTTSPSAAAWSETDLAADPHAAPDKADRIQRMFSAIAGRYDLNNRIHSFGRDQAWRRRAVALCKVQSGDRVLDAACGTGDLAIAFARAGAATVIGVDFAESMLELARVKTQRLKLRGLRTMPTYEFADVTKLPFEDQSFDIVSIAFGIRNVANTAAALREFRRVLRPDGRLVILEFSRPRNPIVRLVNAVYCDRIMPITASLIAGDRTGAYRYLPRSVKTYLSAEQLAEMLLTCGFATATSYPLAFGVCTATLAQVGAENVATAHDSR